MTDSELSKQIFELIQTPIGSGSLRPRTLESIQMALAEGRCFYVATDEIVVASVIIDETSRFFKVSTLVCHPDHQGKGYANRVIAQSIVRFAPCDKPLVTVAVSASKKLFLKLGFVEQPKNSAPVELWGGRTKKEWQACDRSFMVYQS